MTVDLDSVRTLETTSAVIENVIVIASSESDSVLGKRVLTYRENRGSSGYSYMEVVLVTMENYTFLER